MSIAARASKPATKPSQRPRDVNQLAHFQVAEATRDAVPALQIEPEAMTELPASKSAPKKNVVAGGRASALSRDKSPPEKRKEPALKAAEAKWSKG